MYESANSAIFINLDNAVDYDQNAYSQLRPFDAQQLAPLPHTDLVFDSKFEGGNLAYAFRRNDQNDYDLFLQNDTNTMGYCQWFYFSVRNMRKDTEYRFNIVNQVKITHIQLEKKTVAICRGNEASSILAH